MTVPPIPAILAAGDGDLSLTHFPEQADLLKFAQTMGPGMAALLIILGIVYLLFGFKIFKTLVMLNAVVVVVGLVRSIGEPVVWERWLDALLSIGGPGSIALTLGSTR